MLFATQNIAPQVAIFQAEDGSMTGTWYQALQFYSQCLGGWRRRRRGLGNIMVDPSLN